LEKNGKGGHILLIHQENGMFGSDSLGSSGEPSKLSEPTYPPSCIAAWLRSGCLLAQVIKLLSEQLDGLPKLSDLLGVTTLVICFCFLHSLFTASYYHIPYTKNGN
jgi:hypothetical protein